MINFFFFMLLFSLKHIHQTSTSKHQHQLYLTWISLKALFLLGIELFECWVCLCVGDSPKYIKKIHHCTPEKRVKRFQYLNTSTEPKNTPTMYADGGFLVIDNEDGWETFFLLGFQRISSFFYAFCIFFHSFSLSLSTEKTQFYCA